MTNPSTRRVLFFVYTNKETPFVSSFISDLKRQTYLCNAIYMNEGGINHGQKQAKS